MHNPNIFRITLQGERLIVHAQYVVMEKKIAWKSELGFGETYLGVQS